MMIDDPHAQFGTMAFGINNVGTIVGSYDNAHGFIFRDRVFHHYDAPQAPGEAHNTQLNGINNLGWITGQVFTGGIWRGFWLIGKDFDFLEAPAGRDSEVMSINARADVVGCHDFSGFISFNVEQAESKERTEQFPLQEKLASCVMGINFSRVVVGSYSTMKKPYGFLGVPALTLKVNNPANHSYQTSPIHVVASAWGMNPISEIQVWANFKKVFEVKKNQLNAYIQVPAGLNERFVVQAVDSKNRTTKIVQTITINQ